MSKQIQKKQLHILSKSKLARVKERNEEESIFKSFIQLHIDQRENYHIDIRDQQLKDKKELQRLCQSIKKNDVSTRFHKQRQSQSLQQSPQIKVWFQTPLLQKVHRKFQKTPFPKQ
ncbi:unnamed protein product (macronuclear) [Paramecium tetraurelia]|uniref:Uncharacterized protein n=1 Tax=Paramecium tetraurelia TaxID=5888 RepID=A0BU27_PARTE|nr:uncharacterized protein GSPATT00032276001 [Paramecium tetraurelia]CAK62044.1 unnamed protein product [Paramecium tetraurelia]|eukprot:XP_001429442.1 hypothetical protein (macronuclear) [Paramecium tetraurelia strain d4-2]